MRVRRLRKRRFFSCPCPSPQDAPAAVLPSLAGLPEPSQRKAGAHPSPGSEHGQDSKNTQFLRLANAHRSDRGALFAGPEKGTLGIQVEPQPGHALTERINEERIPVFSRELTPILDRS